MKRLLCTSLSHLYLTTAAFCAEPPPSLQLSRAAEIAQQQIDSMKLGPEYFLRSVVLIKDSSTKLPIYEAAFEPPKSAQIKVGEEPPPAVIRIIQVSMDGTAKIIERQVPRSRTIIRSKAEQGAAANP